MVLDSVASKDECLAYGAMDGGSLVDMHSNEVIITVAGARGKLRV